MFPVAKRTLPLLDAFALGSIRYSIGIVLFIAILVAAEGRQALRWQGRFLPAAVYGLVGFCGFNLFVWWGLASTRPEHAAIIMALQTPMTAIAMWAARGLRPFIRDEGLTQAARACAAFRARSLLFGHTGNDFAFVPAGTSASSAGCAASLPHKSRDRPGTDPGPSQVCP